MYLRLGPFFQLPCNNYMGLCFQNTHFSCDDCRNNLYFVILLSSNRKDQPLPIVLGLGHDINGMRYIINLLWASYQIRKIACCACAGKAGNVFSRRRLQRKLLVSDPGMHHGTCVTHVPWCTSVSPTRGGGENVPSIPGACASASVPIW